MEGKTSVEPVTSLAEGTEERSEVATSCFPLTEKSPLLENVDSKGMIAMSFQREKITIGENAIDNHLIKTARK